jgi:hypothetical protein
MVVQTSSSPTFRPIRLSIPTNTTLNFTPLLNRHPSPLIVNGQLNLHALAASHLSPDSALNVLCNCEWTTEGTIAIVQGIVNAMHAHQTEYDLKVGKLESNIR